MLEDVAAARLRTNRTRFHESRYGDAIELLGAAGELVARDYLGLPLTLHTGFDGGRDLKYCGLTIDVKTTRLTRFVQHRCLQLPEYRTIQADVVFMVGVHLKHRVGVPIGIASGHELNNAPINRQRDTPCHEIPITDLGSPYILFTKAGQDEARAQYPALCRSGAWA